MQRLLFLIAIAWGLSYWGAPAHDPDLGWHLFGGEYIFEQQQVPRADLINSFNSQWVDYHWLAQLALYCVFRIAGYEGLSITLGAVTALTALLLMKLCIRTRSPAAFLAALFSFALLMPLLGQVSSVRPQVFSFLGVAWALSFLRFGRYRRRPATELLALFPLTVLLANCHVNWIWIAFLWGCLRVLPRFSSGRHCLHAHPDALPSAWAWGGLALLSCSGFFSPYAIGNLLRRSPASGGIFENYFVLLDYLSMPSELSSSISEFRSTLAAQPSVSLGFVLTLVLCLRLLRLRSLARLPGEWVLFFVGAGLALGSVKFLALYAIFSAPILSRGVHLVLRSLNRRFPGPCSLQRFSQRIAGATLCLCIAYAVQSFPSWRGQLQILEAKLPLNACAQIGGLGLQPRAGRQHLRVLTFFDYGGWCRWQAQLSSPSVDIRVTTDGRTQFVPPEHYKRAFDLYRVNFAWYETLELWNPDVVLAEKGRALAEVLGRSPLWSAPYQDARFVLFVPKSS